MATVDTASRIVNSVLPQAFKAALHVIPRRTMKPILSGVHVVAGADGIRVSATDLELGFVARMPSNPDGAVASVVIPRDAVDSWAKSNVETIDVDGDFVVAEGARVPSGHGMEFPAVDMPGEYVSSRTLPLSKLSSIAEHIGAATDADSSRYALGGIYVESGAGCVRFVGTDGRRLHVFRLSGSSDGPFHHVVPAAAFVAVVKCVDKTLSGMRGADKKKAAAQTFVRIVVDDKGRGAFLWSVGNCEFAVSWRAIEGRFPRYRDVFPAFLESDGDHSAGALEVADMLRQAELCRKTICSEKSKGIDVGRDDQDTFIAARSAEKGEYRQHLKAYIVAGWKRRLDPAFVADVMRAAAAFGYAALSPVTGDDSHVDIFGTRDAGDAMFFGHPSLIFRDGARDAFAAVIMPLAAD